MLHEKESLSGLELVVRERELIATLTFDLDRGDADGGVVLQGSSTVRAVARLVLVRMSTAGAVHLRALPTPSLDPNVQVEASTSTSIASRRYRPRSEGSTAGCVDVDRG